MSASLHPTTMARLQAEVVAQVLAMYPDDCGSQRIESLGSVGGFSGARFWRLDSARGRLCLRRWPAEHPSRERLAFIHAVLDHVNARGFTTIPVPIRALAGESCCAIDGHLWELTDWLPGAADYLAAPSRAKLEAAMSALARWHLAAADFPRANRSPSPSPGIAPRLRHLNQLPGVLAKLSIDAEIKASKEPDWSRLAALANRLIVGHFSVEPAVRTKLESAASTPVSLQPCIRDIWSDHVLFEGNQVSGIIDFGAMRVETVAGDIARLLGSLAGDDLVAWQRGLEAYQAIRPLSDEESALVSVFDESTMLLAGFNWLEWIIIGQRQFENPPEVIRRLTMIVSRLEILSNSLARRP
jgi:Ser/Thr protein kinase RdoA (MazF antagonist)